MSRNRALLALLALLAFVACDHSVEKATHHLLALGYHVVTCDHDGTNSSMCYADGHNFRCVASSASGCEPATVACEQFIQIPERVK